MFRALFVLTVLLCLGCSGALESITPVPIPPEHQDMVGVWEGEGAQLVIDSNGSLIWSKTGGAGNSRIQAPIQAWTEDGFDAGVGPLTSHFVVSVPPHEVDGSVRMTVEGVELTRQGAAPQDATPIDGVVQGGEAQPSAAQAVPEDRQNLVGSWRGVDRFLLISPDGWLLEQRQDPTSGAWTGQHGPISAWTPTGFEVDLGGVITPYVLNSPPSVSGEGPAHMTLNATLLERVSLLPVSAP